MVTSTLTSDGQIVQVDPNDPSQGFEVLGDHTYDDDALDAIRVTISDDNGRSTMVDCLATVGDAGLSVTSSTGLQFTQGVPDNQTVATFTDAGGNQSASAYGAQIDWDDGVMTAGKVTYDESAGQFDVSSDNMHAYTDLESHTMTVTVYDEDGSSADASQTVAAAPPTLPGWGQNYQVSGDTFSGLVATFIAPAGTTDPGDFSALITLPDESQVTGRVAAGAVKGEFYVNCPSVTLPLPSGWVTASITTQLSEGGTQVSSATTNLYASLPAYTPTDIDGGHAVAIVGQQFTADLASFNLSGAPTGPLQAEADWGEVALGSVQIASSDGVHYVVEGTNVYDTVGNKLIQLHIYDTDGEFSPFEVWATISVTDDVLAITPAAGLQGVENTPFQGLTVATFTAQAPSRPGDFLALLTWQSGCISMGTIAYDSTNGYTISGDYTYEQPDWYPVSVQVFDTSGTQISASPPNCPTIDVKDGALSRIAGGTFDRRHE